MDEIERIKEAYARRDVEGKARLYSFFRSDALFTAQQRERTLLRALKQNTQDLSDKKILDIGCGDGRLMRDLVRYGASPENLFGIDLLQSRVEKARAASPGMTFTEADASRLPFPDSLFDVALLFTVFTSILDAGLKKAVAKEALRVLKPNGFVIYYDYRYDNPRNPDVRGVGKKEILSLFEGCALSFSLLTLAPPIARLVVPISWMAGLFLEKIKPLDTHYMVVIKKGGT